jgi:hypothetical protein
MSDGPIRFELPQDPGQNQLWGIPILGVFVRFILVIPQLIILWFLGIAVFLASIVTWYPILTRGRMASWGYTIIGGYFRLQARVTMYVALITGVYPPFGMTGDHPVQVEFDQNEEQNRWWGIPLLGLLARWIILIPHWIVLWVLGAAAGIVLFFSWVPILVSRRQAASIVNFIRDYYRWFLRVSAYALLLTGTYPPFRLGE